MPNRRTLEAALAGALLLSLLLAGALRAGDSPAPNADLEALKAYYRSAEDFSVRFEQVYVSKITNRDQTSAGRIDFARPMKMRWEYETPDKRSFITDGQTLWMVEWEDKAVTVRRNLDQSELQTALGFLWGGQDLSRQYTVLPVPAMKVAGRVETGSRPTFELMPIMNHQQFDALYLFLDPKTRRIEEVLMVDVVGNLNHLKFSDPKVKQTFPAGHFAFVPPPGFSVETL